MTLTAHQKICMSIGDLAIRLASAETENEQLKGENERLRVLLLEKTAAGDVIKSQGHDEAPNAP